MRPFRTLRPDSGLYTAFFAGSLCDMLKNVKAFKKYKKGRRCRLPWEMGVLCCCCLYDIAIPVNIK